MNKLHIYTECFFTDNENLFFRFSVTDHLYNKYLSGNVILKRIDFDHMLDYQVLDEYVYDSRNEMKSKFSQVLYDVVEKCKRKAEFIQK